ncbi:Hypothetical Protein FCC1311_079752 [Hondaea fermentalgiana]|uniref:Uncharacterized protein n=1 Tax=Hondaea fermentalgiana TaxID=2315210 RepID=A0A2R5GLJ7_9STRA|nr:Hypothetical Protein FCC1311_079752 [Hondaea fermentalgiana]|eukprot:GBG31750.1 Hypothetical Protein FCC1311_079752 [Hondaea fermentalgiana]
MATTMPGVARRETDELARELIRSLLTECRSVECEYTLEHLLASLVPALVQVAKTWAERGTQTQIQPVNLLARQLYRNNPKFAQSKTKAAREHRRVRELIVEERRALRQKRYDVRFATAVEDELLKLEMWPVEPASGSPCRYVRLHGREITALLDEVEQRTGRHGLRGQLEVVLEVLDVREQRQAEWADFIDAMTTIVKADRPGILSKWLLRELRVKLDLALEDYYGSAEASELIVKALRSGKLTGAGVIRFLEEVRDAALGWEATFEPEEILDARETKCSDLVEILSEDFALIMDAFLDRLANERMKAFNQLSL